MVVKDEANGANFNLYVYLLLPTCAQCNSEVIGGLRIKQLLQYRFTDESQVDIVLQWPSWCRNLFHFACKERVAGSPQRLLCTCIVNFFFFTGDIASLRITGPAEGQVCFWLVHLECSRIWNPGTLHVQSPCVITTSCTPSTSYALGLEFCFQKLRACASPTRTALVSQLLIWSSYVTARKVACI